VAGLVLAGLAVVGVVVFLLVRRQMPAGMVKSVRAGVAARRISDPDQRFAKYIEGLHGPQTDPANREKAFMSFFDPEQIRTLQLLVMHLPDEERQSSIDASARWVQQYRESMTVQQRGELRAQLQTPEGKAMLRKATALYNSQDVEYRGRTSPVISQLLKTVASVQK
jgi:hypothetical protein